MVAASKSAANGRIMRLTNRSGVSYNTAGLQMSWADGRPDVHNRCEEMLHVGMWDGCGDTPNVLTVTGTGLNTTPLCTGHGYTGTDGWELWVNQTTPGDLTSNSASGLNGGGGYTITPSGGNPATYGISGHFNAYGLKSTKYEANDDVAARWQQDRMVFQEGDGMAGIRFPSVEVEDDEYVVYFHATKDDQGNPDTPIGADWDFTDPQCQYIVDCRGQSTIQGRDGSISVTICAGMGAGTFLGPVVHPDLPLGYRAYGIFGIPVKPAPVVEPCVVTYGWDFQSGTAGTIIPLAPSSAVSTIVEDNPWPWDGLDEDAGYYPAGRAFDFRGGDVMIFGSVPKSNNITDIVSSGDPYTGVKQPDATLRHSYGWHKIQKDGEIPPPWQYDFNGVAASGGWWWVLLRGVDQASGTAPDVVDSGTGYSGSSGLRTHPVKTDWDRPVGLCILGGNEQSMRMQLGLSGVLDHYGPLISRDSTFMVGFGDPDNVQVIGDPGRWGSQSTSGSLYRSAISFNGQPLTNYVQSVAVLDTDVDTVITAMTGAQFIISNVEAGVEVGTTLISYRPRRDAPRRQFVYMRGLDGDMKGVLS